MRRLVGIVLVVLAACGGSEADPDPSRATTSTTASTTSTTLVAASGECGLEGSYPEPWPERPRYQAELDVDPDAGTVRGELAVVFTPPESTDRLVFRLWANGPRSGAAGGRMEIVEATVDGAATTGTYESGNAGPGTPGTIYVLTREGGFDGGIAVDVRLSFELDMPGPINERIAKVGSSLRLGSILPTLSWIRGAGWHTSPAVENFSESVASEVADYDVRVRAPESFTVLATGEEVEPGRFQAWAVRDWAATVGRLDVVEGSAQGGRTRVIVGVAEGSGDDPDRRLADTVAALDDFLARYGPYPATVLSVGVTSSLSGGIEFPEHLMVGAGSSRDHLIHEVAHMWFYSLVGNDQYADPWLDEGLTEYAESRFLANTASVRAKSVPGYGQGRLGEGHDYWAANTDAFFRSVYVQGTQALAAFGDEVGGLDAVDCGLRRYVLDSAYSVAEPADLVEALEAQTGVDPTPVFERFGAL
ncbi:MAG: hypothetical protein HYU28_01475 [Actinobacteria bacterium]|nr:hypothetical protein [Actinomycetota bacterium]